MQSTSGAAQHPPRIAIVDADRRVRQSLSDLLSIAGVAVVGVAGEIPGATALVDDTRPTVLLVDPRLPDIDAGEAFLAGLATSRPDLRIVLMGWSDPMERPSLMRRAIAFLPKGSTPEEFVAAILAACGCEP